MQVIAAFNAQELSKLCDYFAVSGAKCHPWKVMYFCHAYGVAFGERIFCSIQVDKNIKLMACEATLLDILIFFFSLQTVVDFIKKKKRDYIEQNS